MLVVNQYLLRMLLKTLEYDVISTVFIQVKYVCALVFYWYQICSNDCCFAIQLCRMSPELEIIIQARQVPFTYRFGIMLSREQRSSTTFLVHIQPQIVKIMAFFWERLGMNCFNILSYQEIANVPMNIQVVVFQQL